MESATNKRTTALLILVISLRIPALITCGVQNVRSGDTTGGQSTKTEYQMLAELDYEKAKLRKNSDAGAVRTDMFVIETKDAGVGKNISEKYGFILVRKVFEDENYYLFRRRKCRKRCKRSLEDVLQEVQRYLEIKWTARQNLRHREHRMLPEIWPNKGSREAIFSEVENLLSRSGNSGFSGNDPNFNDPLFKEQWYLHGSSPAENDIGVLPVWRSGVTGRGVAISVLDDGVCSRNPEVADNYDSEISENYLFRSTSFQPIPENSHGTRCAAIAAGVANNSICGVGVAYEAKVGGVRILDGPLTDVQEALSLVHALDRVDIYTASWGPDDKGGEVDGPKMLARLAFIKGVTMGRQGKGSIYVWAAGNGGSYHDNCSLDGYASSPYTLTVGALSEDGQSTQYTEPCASVIASTYVGGSSQQTSTWRSERKINVIVPEGRGKCKETFQGTSAAAPMAAGVIALALQANPRLTWRDVQHLIIRTSRVPNTKEKGWLVNGAGFVFHPKMGSGVLDASALVQLARKWTPVRSLRVLTVRAKAGQWLILPGKLTTIPVSALQSTNNQIDRLETVIFTINLRHPRRGDLEMTAQSPAGTRSPILTRRPNDNGTTGFRHWDFVSLHFWGESPGGTWLLSVRNHKGIVGRVDYLSVTFYGTGEF